MTDRARPLGRDLIATLAVTATSVAVAAGFARAFAGWQFLVDLATIAIVGHGLSFVLRRAGVSPVISTVSIMLVMLWLVGLQQYGPTLQWTLPTADTWDLLGAELRLVRDQFPTAVAPVPYFGGWATLAATGIVSVVVLADTFAFHVDARGEAIVPGGVLFVFVSAVGDERLRVELTMVLVAAAVVAVVALRRLHDRTRQVEAVGARPPQLRFATAAVGTAGAVALVAGLVGTRLPGADSEPLFDTKGRSGGVTEVISPLVDIRSRLVNQSDAELVRILASEPAYWRVTTLPEFDGDTFRLPDRPLEQVDGAFASGRPGTSEIRQEIEIQALGGQLVPAAADPIGASGAGLRWNADTSTLVKVGDELGQGERFTVVSASPRLQPTQLRSTTSASPPDAIYLELPDDFPASVREQAIEVTAGTATTYDAAIALQRWFRDEFRYSLDVQRGHGTSAIESFLRERVGYCEQFAATFAAMARSIGLPARVAVGFTQGLQLPDGWYSVLGRNAHAWPEVWFDRVGWVPFEPTPGRGAPGTEQYTGVAPAQDGTPAGSGDGDGTAPPTTAVSATPTTVAGAGDAGAPDVPGLLPDGGVEVPQEQLDTSGGVSWRPFVIAAVIALLLALPALVRRVRRRLRVGVDPRRQVIDAWHLAISSARRVGVPGTAAWTPHEWARATRRLLPVAARPMTSLADVVDVVAYAPPDAIDLAAHGPYGTSVARECAAWAHQIERISRDALTPKQRAIDYFVRFD